MATPEAKLSLSLDDLIKTSKQARARKPAPAAETKAAQVKARSQALRADKVSKAREMDVDAAGKGAAGAKKRAPLVKPSTKAARPAKGLLAGRVRLNAATNAASKAKAAKANGSGAKKSGAFRMGGQSPAGGKTPPVRLVVHVKGDAPSPARRASQPSPVVRGGRNAGGGASRAGGGGGRGGGRAPLVQPGGGGGARRAALAGKKGRAGNKPAGGGRGIAKPVPRGPATAFGSKTANAAARAVARTVVAGGGGAGKAAGKGSRGKKGGKGRGMKM
jgi:hypothetical protein